MLKILSQRSKIDSYDSRYLPEKEAYCFFFYNHTSIPNFMTYVQVIIKDAK